MIRSGCREVRNCTGDVSLVLAGQSSEAGMSDDAFESLSRNARAISLTEQSSLAVFSSSVPSKVPGGRRK
ncbi:hypothetical protein J8273_0019 [Carpediemonas membranifera]|uniref:Uncharacterized protein n=1 Tax=Carpediemonas membranifera TaxID=201153 RepID=A0A8J6B3B1_9EUKA|nr:hypothetical protein J8273_0019 [Carpediemonas membranifera]|eukprot:KAG9394818.1 hypothetical protein J8273_0019 [Carpediemonas membranifera]